MKQARVVVAFILVPLMVFSAGGFNIFTHWCHHSDVKLVSFQGPESCDHEQGDHHSVCGDNCCSQKELKQPCCEDDHLFIQTNENLSDDDDRPVINSESVLFIHLPEIVFVEPAAVIPEEYCFTDYVSPPGHPGKFTVVKYGSLKIDC